MKAKSDTLTDVRKSTSPATPRSAGRKPTVRMPASERRAQILDKAFEFFAEYGLTAQTRALADACGVSQRLLYSLFPSKSALIQAVYEADIAGVFKAIWFVQLRDRSKPIKDRLDAFYKEYYASVLTRRWMRLFLYASLAEVGLASTYIASIITQMLEILVDEAAHDAGLALPEDPVERQEIGWILHGSVSHLAIRRHIYRNDSHLDADKVIELQVNSFLAGLPALLPPASAQTS